MVSRARTIDADLLSEIDKERIEQMNDSNSAAGEESVSANGKKLPSWKKNKMKGQNKHRPPPMKVQVAERICPSLVDIAEDEEPKECPYGAKCQYKHDLKTYMEERKPDVLPGGCYNYRTTGRCPRGVSCLFGSEHLTPEGRNKVNPDILKDQGATKAYANFLSKDLQHQLRKKQYNFDKAQKIAESTKRSDNKKPNPTADAAAEVEPAPKKICLSVPVTDEDVISLRPEEKKKVAVHLTFHNCAKLIVS